MNYLTINFKKSTNRKLGLPTILSIFLFPLFFAAIALPDEKEIVNGMPFTYEHISQSKSSTITITTDEPQDESSKINNDFQQAKIREQTGTSSFISNYVNAWKLSKVTPSYQIIT